MAVKKVLITGAGGFIGSHLTEACVREGFKVRALVHYNSKGDWGWLEQLDVKDKIEVVLGDVTDLDSVASAMSGVDTVLNLAALVGIPYSYHAPESYIRTNIVGTHNILRASLSQRIKNVIVTSTSETYGTVASGKINENYPQSAQSPYAASKIGADQLALSFARSFGLPVKIVRPFNTYGSRQSARAVIPTVILQMLSDSKKITLGNTKPKRDFTYVADIVSGFLEIAKSHKFFGEVVNVGSGDEISIDELVKLISGILKKKVTIAKDKKRIRPKESEVERLLCDNSKLKKFTGWRPRYSLEKGINETVEWFKKNKDVYKKDMYNI